MLEMQVLLSLLEINNIKQIIGLKQDKNYKDTSQCKIVGRVITTDSDVDGSYRSFTCKFFHYWWPSFLRLIIFKH
jgi:DNA gyrase/topoisomerase IV subunit B